MVQPWNPKVYAYVSSGGMYLVPPTGPLIEGGPVKLDNKQLANENHARKLGMNWCAFRPQTRLHRLVLGSDYQRFALSPSTGWKFVHNPDQQ